MNWELKPLSALAIFGSLVIVQLAGPLQASLYHANGVIGSNVDFQSQLPFKSYSLELGVQAGGGVSYDNFGPNQPSQHAQASSIAEGYALHAHTFAQYIVIPPALGAFNYYTLFSNSTAWLIYTDVKVSGPLGGTVSTSLNLKLDGSHSGGVTADPGGSAFTASTVNVSVSVNGVGVGNGYHEVDLRSDSNVIRTVGIGMLENWDTSGGNIVTSPFNVQSGVPFEVRLQLDTSASVSGYFSNVFGLTAAANTDFGNTLSFPVTGPVFNLPSGYTANGGEGIIVNNSIVIPEPGSLLLLALGLIGGCAWHLRSCIKPI